MASTDTAEKKMRDSLALSATKASDISYVSDEKICLKAVAALNILFGTPQAVREVYVWKYGPDYLVEDPTYGTESDYRGLRIFDRRWVYKRTLLTF